MEKISMKLAFFVFIAISSVMSITETGANRFLQEEASQTVLLHIFKKKKKKLCCCTMKLLRRRLSTQTKFTARKGVILNVFPIHSLLNVFVN
ncbi:unnamed protein product, partial [Brassica rapa]